MGTEKATNMLAVDVDRDFLTPFRRRDAETAYIGLGHFLDALARFAAYREDHDVEALRTRILSALAETRETNGYIGLFPESRRLSQLWDIHETSHLIYGVATDHRYRPKGPALDLARGLAAWLMGAWRADPERPARQVVMATLDLEPALLNLYAETGDDGLLDFCIRDRRLSEWNRPIVEGRWGRIEGHVYDYLSRCIAQLTLMRWRPSLGLTRATGRALEYMLHGDGMMITAEVGDHECWHGTQEGTVNLEKPAPPRTSSGCSICCSVTRVTLSTGTSWSGQSTTRSSRRSLRRAAGCGTTLLSIGPGRTSARTPTAARTTSGGSCPNSRQWPATRRPAGCSSTSTRRPRSGQLLRMEPRWRSGCPPHTPRMERWRLRSSRSSLYRSTSSCGSPAWCAGASVTVTGEPEARAASAGAACPVSRTWRRGDRLELRLPMATRFVAGRGAQSGRAAVMRGPQVYCLGRKRNPGLEGKDLRLIVMDPGTLVEAAPDSMLRPDGTTIPLRASSFWGPATGGGRAAAAEGEEARAGVE